MAWFRTLGVVDLPGGRMKPHQRVDLDAATAAGLLAAGMIEPAGDDAGATAAEGGFATEDNGQDMEDLVARLKAQIERAELAEEVCETLKAERDALKAERDALEARLAEADLAALRGQSGDAASTGAAPAAKPAAASKAGKAKGAS